MHGHACKQYIFWSYNTSTFSAVRFDKASFTCQCETEDKRVSNLARLWAIFKQHPGSEGVKLIHSGSTKTYLYTEIGLG